MNENYYAVIMAGGVGSRFWPMSTKDYPKQFHDMLGTGESLIQKTFKRFERLIPTENILISTNKNYEKLVRSQLENTTKKQLLLEPSMRNTSPCILYAALKIYAQNPDAVMIIAPSDHWIDDVPNFIENIETAFEYCQQNDVLMTLGIEPNSPNTGYGYIQFENAQNEIKKVKKFTEKPNLETAKEFINSGDYLWNAGIFIWSVKSIIKSFQKSLPEMYDLFSKGNNVYNSEFEDDFIETNYSKSQDISIDFGILEKAQNVCVLPVDFGWNDLGTWGSLYEKLPKDNQNNATVGGEVIFRDSTNNIIRTQKNKKVVIQGLENFIVVENEDVLLICPKTEEQEIKEITKQVKKDFGDTFV
ncbi:mannose-1-phosphate guanylyltransferase [Urechidicola croceus]|uniref:mannose-1-phosphate guanylyltransferase n=1 Tax=Urechidicola croceus TaxID=1850246 RepID=A0A1D8P6V1_9FLAO|nr:mannose-1-phosphate guanylyltransferase [Urechidicola croceus]AOW20301.1 mannose-1-phosphate guanylyltransferase [Urechidicola croceus]